MAVAPEYFWGNRGVFNDDWALASADEVSKTQEAVVEVSSAEILALNSSPKEIVPAPGADKVLDILSIVVELDYGTTPYATNTSGQFNFGGAGNFTLDLSFSADGILKLIPQAEVAAANTALVLTEPSGDPTAGDSTLTVHVLYAVRDV